MAKLPEGVGLIRHGLMIGFAYLFLVGCGDAATEQSASAIAVPANSQRGNGLPYEVADSEVWDVADPVSGRDYQIFVALPPSYRKHPQRRYPTLYVTDADYAFPLIKQIARRLNVEGATVDEFVLVGLSYAKGDEGAKSRRRDYTPTANGPSGSPPDEVHGKSKAYIAYLKEHVLPFVEGRYRTDEARRLFLGHSYGELLGMQIALSEPRMFEGYILGSPSFWFDKRYILGREAAYAAANSDLSARIYMYIGEYEEMRPGDPRFAKTVNMVTDTMTMDRALKSRNYPTLKLQTDVLSDENHLTVAPRGFTKGLLFLLPTSTGR